PPRGDARRMNRAADHFFHPLVERLAPNLPLRLPALRLHARSPAVRGSMPRWQGCYTRSISSGTEGTPQHDLCTRNHTRQRLRDLVADVEAHLHLNGPWPYHLSELYY